MSKICPDETKLSEHPIVFNRDDDDDDDEDDMKEYDHNFVEVEKFEYVMPPNDTKNFLRDPYVLSAVTFCPLYTGVEMLKSAGQHSGKEWQKVCCGWFKSIFCFPWNLCCCWDDLLPCMLTEATDKILLKKYNYNIDEAVGSSKFMGIYPVLIFPCTAFPVAVQIVGELKKRDKKYNKYLFGPRLAPRPGKDIVWKDHWRLSGPTSFFLSHAWGNYPYEDHERVCKVGDKLKDIKDIKVFLDRDSMTGDTKKTMAMGIKMTKVVLVFITQGYIDRVEAAWENNCKYEWEAACNLNKRLYPVVMDPKLRNPSSWGALLSAKLGGVIYADFATDENIDICVETILKETHKWRL